MALISFWDNESNIKHIFHQFDEMLIVGKEMFAKSSDSIFNPPANMEALGKELNQLDSKINELHQLVRRDIITHISVHGTEDILPCFLLITLIKDAERLGDYTKNIQEIAERCPSIKDDPLAGKLKTMQENILLWFDQTKGVFENLDHETAQEIREATYAQAKECDQYVWNLIDDQQGRNALGIAIQFRFFKRITAHMGNILSSVQMPFDKVDYFEKAE